MVPLAMGPGCRTTGWGILLKCPGFSGCLSGLVHHGGPVIEPFAGGVPADFRGAFQEAINDNKEHGQQKQLTRDNGLGYPRNRQSPGTSSTFYIHAVPFPPVFPHRRNCRCPSRTGSCARGCQGSLASCGCDRFPNRVEQEKPSNISSQPGIRQGCPSPLSGRPPFRSRR